MPRTIAIDAETAERRVYHAQLVTCLAVIPTFMGLSALATGATMGDRDMRGLLLAHPLAFGITLVIAMLFLLAWWLLGRRHRAGVVLAAALFAWMLVSAFRPSALSFPEIAFAAIGLVVTVHAWPAMRRSARPLSIGEHP